MSDQLLISVIRVADFDTSLIFYRDKLGFRVDWIDVEIRTAQLVGPKEELLVLTDDPELNVLDLYPAEQVAAAVEDPAIAMVTSVPPEQVADVQAISGDGEGTMQPPAEWPKEELEENEEGWTGKPLVEEVEGEEEREKEKKVEAEARWQFREVESGGTLSFQGENLLMFQEHLSVLAVPDLLLEESPGVDQVLTLSDPDGYRVAFYEDLRMSESELIDLYRKGPDLLEGAMLGLTEEDLDLPVDEEMTIRQVVLQIIDFDMEMMQRIKWALAESGRSYPIPLYDADEWVETLAYQHRPVHVELSMHRLIRDHVLTLCERVENALERHLVSEQGTVEVRTMMQVVAEASREQIQSILETRHQHGK
ncbi:hypothetical protein [Desmospora activa]|uniref:Uncharacterized protein n=1 Tax=Desmospora activa DSM 45169 TaxID=1121389 RepID=A0A2T4ZDC2_9BACL|nr:hypothetical protein [Desmospora activa]PTM59879.1 hypothetical protein C8J48_2516 [Desmospora activa DSM 45169]